MSASPIPIQIVSQGTQLTKPQDVTSTTPAYDDMYKRWDLINKLMGGTEAMRLARQNYLPQNSGEDFTSYVRRLNKTFLYEAFLIAINTLSGKPFSEDVVVNADVLKGPLKDYIHDMDKLGNDITTFLRSGFRSGLAKGHVHVLVDYSNTQGATVSLAQKAALGHRPYCVKIDVENLTGWRYEMEGNVPVLTQVRIREVVSRNSGQWGEVLDIQYRVFERIVSNGVPLVAWSLYTSSIDQTTGVKVWSKTDGGYTSTKQIPLVTVYFSNKEGIMETRPPLMGLAHLSVEHWQSSSEQRNILNVARCPIWFFAGYNDVTGGDDGAPAQQVTIGPDRMIRSDDPNAKFSIVEHSGAAIAAGRQDLLDIEARMAHCSTEMLAPGNLVQMSATESTHENNGEDCLLASMVKACEDGATTILGLMYEYEAQEPPAGKLITINTSFGLEPQDAADLQTLYQSRMTGMVTHATYLKELKRRGVLSPDTDLVSELSGAKEEGPVPVPMKDNSPATAGKGPNDMTAKGGAGA